MAAWICVIGILAEVIGLFLAIHGAPIVLNHTGEFIVLLGAIGILVLICA